MIINVAGGDECRIAVLEGGRLEELYIERQSAESHVGSIYKGRVTNVEPSIQAAFIDFGQARNGFLHISDVHPMYFPDHNEVSEDVGKKIPRRDRPLIQRCFRRGQEAVVQVTKEGVGTKGPTLTTYLSIPGRFLVMMPGMSRVGVSRKIEDQVDRRAMREVLSQLPLPEGMGFILRTAGMGQSKRELQRDLNYLNRLWKIIADRTRNLRAPAELYQESDLVIRTIRDVLTSDFRRIVVDDERTAAKAEEFLKIALPRTQSLVEVYRNHQPIFHKYGIEEEIERINSRHVPLPLGGSIVIDPTEAMVAIDVNSGRFRDVDDAEKSALQINLQAAEEIARQLRLRDLGGLIVCDFIDMRPERNRREVERTLRNALKKHKERARILRMSQFGLIEMTRQRQRPSIKRSIYSECPHCRGSGLVKTTESMVLEVMRMVQLAAHQPGVKRVRVTVCPEAAFVVQNQKRARLYELEQDTQTELTIRGDVHYAVDQIGCECEDDRGRPVKPPS
ncbi:MAG: Rne/Rng family ribonuclease [Planctomycetota bacterium]|jgi:ribonuclease E